MAVAVVAVLASLTTWIEALGVYRDRRIVWIGLLGFSSGIPLALTFSTLTFWLFESGISKSAIGLFASVATPYTLKFLWAPLIDRLRLPLLCPALGRRRGWLLFTQVALMLSLLGLGATHPESNAWMTALFAVLTAFWSASQDIVVDAYRVEILDTEQYAAGSAAYVLGYRVAMLVSGAGALFMATVLGWFEVYAVMAALVLVGVFTTLASAEPAGVEDAEGAQVDAEIREYLAARPQLQGRRAAAAAWIYAAVVCPFADFMQRPGWLAILAFVMLYKFGDALAGVMTNPFLLELDFTKTEIATVVKTYGFFATIAGSLLGGAMMKALGMVRSLWICGLFQMFSNLMFAVQAGAGHSNAMLVATIGIENLASGMGTTAFVAYLSSLCSVSYTATQYALLSSVMSAARTWLSSSGGWLAENMSWVAFFILTTGAAVPGLLLLAWITRKLPLES